MSDLVLVVDDEANIRDLAKLYLEKEGFEVKTAVSGNDAIDKFRTLNPDIMVLDLMMPDKDGWDVCKEIRQESSIPIIMLTARSEDIDKIIGLDMGADDYMTKPFNPRELNARVRAVLRRANKDEDAASTKAREVGNVMVDTDSHEVTVAGNRVNLRVKEFDLLSTLMDHKNIVLSRDQLLDQVWGYEYYGNTRTVDVHIAHLRDKLEGATVNIETVWGKGYKLTEA